jgi:YHS domain-containing protein
MIKFLILFAVGYLLYRSMKSWMFPNSKPKTNVSGQKVRQIDDVMIKDPYCQAYFPKRNAVHLNSGGDDLYFCSQECRDKYRALKTKDH